MHKIRNFTVLPSLPGPLAALRAIAGNMFWSWNPEIIELFRHMDSELWEKCGHNPIKLLGTVSQARLNSLAENEGFLYQLRGASEKLEMYLNSPTWYDKIGEQNSKSAIAYFSFEFGIHECLPIYSGGLGILAGDHIKSASDIGVPLVGMGLLYQQGYFRQYLNADGWQQERYIPNDFYNMPIELVRKRSQQPLTINIAFPQRRVMAQIWKATIGRINLYLLDTNISANSSSDRQITSALYSGDSEMRIQQEILLGIGGIKALLAMGIEPTVCHMNEGHAAFMVLERIRHLKNSHNMTFAEAVEATKASNVFTIHTPVKAGNDEFSPELVMRYFSNYFPKLGINKNQFLGLGRVNPDQENEAFKMPVLALRFSTYRNGVSLLHGEVSRSMWANLWSDLPAKEVPITSITNGIHTKTFLSAELNSLYERYLGFNWADEVTDEVMWRNIDKIPDEEFWRIHQRNKEALISFVRQQIKKQMLRRGTYHTELGWAEEVLDPDALTIGFARRFAAYKRGNLLLRDIERLIKLLTNSDKPIQLIFAGKAHPRDSQGKEIIRQIVHFANRNDVRRRLVFLEDYDIDVARYMVQGVDVWLNNPRVPMEASGTSGMKAAVNGVLNVSTLDGWWKEGYRPESGWVIGAGETYDDFDYQDTVESQAIFNLLENEIIPLFYTRSSDKLPRAWIHRMKNSVKYIAPQFNTNRMVSEYTRRFYVPAEEKWHWQRAQAFANAKALAEWKNNLKQTWDKIAIEEVDTQVIDETVADNGKEPQLVVGSRIKVTADVRLDGIRPDDVTVQIYYGPTDSWGNISNGVAVDMAYQGNGNPQEVCTFAGHVPCLNSGKCGFALRVLPKHEDMADPYEPGMILWES